MATAYVISNFYEKNIQGIKFQTKSGELIVNRTNNLYEMDFPSRMPDPIDITDQMSEALGIRPVEAYLSRDLILVLDTEDDVKKNAKPDFSKLKLLPDGMGTLITAKGDDYDFVSRCFFPKITINEDPVCGSAHCNFIPYWAKKLGKDKMIAKQLSDRGGVLFCRNAGERVSISGSAILYSIADILID